MPKGFFTTLITITGVKVNRERPGTNEATFLKFNTLGFSSIPERKFLMMVFSTDILTKVIKAHLHVSPIFTSF